MAEPNEAAELPPRVAAAATPPHYVRRHRDILPGPTKGHQARVWGILFELLVQEGSVAIGEDRQLRMHDAERLADRMVLRTETILEGFAWLARRGLLGIRVTADGHFATPDLGALEVQLREQQALERVGARASDTLTFFRARRAWVRLPWLRRVLGEESE